MVPGRVHVQTLALFQMDIQLRGKLHAGTVSSPMAPVKCQHRGDALVGAERRTADAGNTLPSRQHLVDEKFQRFSGSHLRVDAIEEAHEAGNRLASHVLSARAGDPSDERARQASTVRGHTSRDVDGPDARIDDHREYAHVSEQLRI